MPIEAVLQASDETNRKIEYFLLGAEEPRGAPNFKFADMRLRDFELAGEPVFRSVMAKFAAEELAFMKPLEIQRQGESLGVQIMVTLSTVRQERRALLDSGKLSEEAFEEYLVKWFRN